MCRDHQFTLDHKVVKVACQVYYLRHVVVGIRLVSHVDDPLH